MLDQAEFDEQLLVELGAFAYDPYAFVLWAFPWGEPGTELADETGPDDWQKLILCCVRDNLLTVDQALQIAVTSGHGVGKSALVGWLVWWAYSTFPGTRGVVTANTENQLKTKTWVEIAKWHRLFIAAHMFKCTATAVFSVDEKLSREWRIDIVPWSERNTEAFAGLHNAGKRLLIIFDEASAIPDIIWQTTMGALTDVDTEILWFVFGNPTREDGFFRDCFQGGKFAHRWYQLKVDSRSVKRTNKKQIQDWIDDFGIDSDFVKVRVLGEFPSGAILSFIGHDEALKATERVLTADGGPVILGVDVARFGDDLSVIWPRRGRDAAFVTPIYIEKNRIDQLAEIVVREYWKHSAVAAMIDGTGVGGGVVDMCRAAQLRVIEVGFGNKPDGFEDENYLNKRAEIWGSMRKWIQTGRIPRTIAGRDMAREFSTPHYTVDEKGKIKLEPKDMIKRRGAESPDFADALACTFAFPIAENAHELLTRQFVTDYDPHAQEHAYA